jgi:putative transposase
MVLKASFHCIYDLNYSLVLVTKYRKKCFSQEMIEYLKEVFLSLCEKWQIKLKEFRAEADHVHLLITSHPSIEMSKLINNFKTVSSRLLRKKFSKELEKYYWQPVLWTRSYCLISIGGANLDTITKYIQNQGNEKL